MSEPFFDAQSRDFAEGFAVDPENIMARLS